MRTPVSLWTAAALLLVAVTVCVGLWWSAGGTHWENTWLPNVGAELFGLYVGVVILELSLGYSRRRDRDASEAPLRLELGSDLQRSRRALLNFVVWTWSANHDRPPRSSIETLLKSWDNRLDERGHLSDELWLRQCASLLSDLVQGVRETGVDRHASGLPPALVASVHEAILELERTATVLPAIASSAELSTLATIGNDRYGPSPLGSAPANP